MDVGAGLGKAAPFFAVRLAALPGLLLVLAGCATITGHDTRLDASLAASSARPFNGVVVVAKGRSIVDARAIGFADRARRTALRIDDRFVIGSLSKQITAALVLREVDRGRIDLDAPISAYLPIDAAWGTQVRIRHLLNHTAGIVAVDAPLQTAPGTTFAYSNLGYDLLGRIVERRADESFDTLARRLFETCGMTQSGTLSATGGRRPVPGYAEQSDGSFAIAPQTQQRQHVASGGVVSTASDLVRWNACLHSGGLLSPSSYTAMTTPSTHRPHRWGLLGYGFGLQVAGHAGAREFSHSGYVPGFIATMTYAPATGESLVVLENTSWRVDDMSRVFAPHDAMHDAMRPIRGARTTRRPVDILHYTARIEPDIAARTIKGRLVLRLASSVDGLDSVTLDNDGLSVDSVVAAGEPLAYKQQGRQLTITLSRPAAAGARREIEIEYHGAPRFGLQFHPDRPEIYSIFSTSQWLIGVDAPDERATLDLSVVLPAGLKTVANGRLVAHHALDDGRILYRWQQDRPVPAYTFGFAAGRFNEATQRHGRMRLRYLAGGFSDAQLRRLFADTADMLRYFERRAGVSYPGDSYTQALVAETIGQEMAGFSLMSEAYGGRVLADPRAGSLIAHEAAHQWWGNMITCRDWTHFWLNEGFATFMAATWMEHRFGPAEYREQVDGWRRRYEALQAAGTDRALVFPNWIKPTADDRAVVYQKGAYVLHLLREELGERDFWNGIRAYTRTHYGRSVNTTDLQRSMEKATGRDLSEFFGRWVYSTGETRLPGVVTH